MHLNPCFHCIYIYETSKPELKNETKKKVFIFTDLFANHDIHGFSTRFGAQTVRALLVSSVNRAEASRLKQQQQQHDIESKWIIVYEYWPETTE